VTGRRRGARSVPLGSYKTLLLRRELSLKDEAIKSHIRVVGKSGSGKSRWLAAFFLNLLKAGFSATLIDPHGDLSRLVLARLVADGFFRDGGGYRRLSYLDLPRAAKQGRYLPFNVLAKPIGPDGRLIPSYDTHTVTRLMLDGLRRAFPSLNEGGSHASPSFEQIVTAGVHVLVDRGLPFPWLRPLLLRTHKSWRDHLLTQVDDELITSFFRDEYDRYDTQERLHLQGSTMRRLFLLLYNPIVRYSLGARDNLLAYRPILDDNRSVIVNLAIPDPDARRLLGSLLTVSVEHGALSRADLPPSARVHTHFALLDEFHEFVAQSEGALTTILSQTRKYGLHAVLSYQTLSQIPEPIQGALQNVEVEVTFRTGRHDAEVAAKSIGSIDPHAVKKQEAVYVAQHGAAQVIDHRSQEYTIGEQWESWTKQIQDQPKQHAFIKDPDGTVRQVKSPEVPDPDVDPDELARVEEHYLRTCFRTPSAAERVFDPDGIGSGRRPPRRYQVIDDEERLAS
jgi:DNA helicase HerA-like ATPase